MKKKFFKFDGEKVTLEVTNYANNGNLAILMNCDEGPYANLTVNLGFNLREDEAYIDTNSLPEALDFIEENSLGYFTGRLDRSGFCEYPLVRFNMDILKEV